MYIRMQYINSKQIHRKCGMAKKTSVRENRLMRDCGQDLSNNKNMFNYGSLNMQYLIVGINIKKITTKF